MHEKEKMVFRKKEKDRKETVIHTCKFKDKKKPKKLRNKTKEKTTKASITNNEKKKNQTYTVEILQIIISSLTKLNNKTNKTKNQDQKMINQGSSNFLMVIRSVNMMKKFTGKIKRKASENGRTVLKKKKELNKR